MKTQKQIIPLKKLNRRAKPNQLSKPKQVPTQTPGEVTPGEVTPEYVTPGNMTPAPPNTQMTVMTPGDQDAPIEIESSDQENKNGTPVTPDDRATGADTNETTVNDDDAQMVDSSL